MYVQVRDNTQIGPDSPVLQEACITDKFNAQGKNAWLEDGMSWLGLYVRAGHVVQQRVRLLKISKDEDDEAEEGRKQVQLSMQNVLYAPSK